MKRNGRLPVPPGEVAEMCFYKTSQPVASLCLPGMRGLPGPAGKAATQALDSQPLQLPTPSHHLPLSQDDQGNQGLCLSAGWLTF